MMRAATVAVVATAIAASATAAPTFPKLTQTFTSTENQKIAIHQGSWAPGANGALCCEGDGGKCKIQAESVAFNFVADPANNRTLLLPFGENEQQYTDYNSGRQYVLSNWACQSYCPLQNDYFQKLGPPPDTPATLVSTATVDGKKLEQWTWNDGLGPIVFEIDTMWVDVTDPTAPKPYNETIVLTPFGQHIGQTSLVYSDYDAGNDGSADFAKITGLSTCKQSQQCQSNSAQQKNLIDGHLVTYAYNEQLKNQAKRDL